MEALQAAIERAMDPAARERFGDQTVEDCRRAFSSLSSSISTLFILATGDQWHHVVYPIVLEVPSSLLFFITYFLTVAVVIVGTMFSAIHHGQRQWESTHQLLDKAH